MTDLPGGPTTRRLVTRRQGLSWQLIAGAPALIILLSVPTWRSSGDQQLLTQLLTLLALAEVWNLLAGFGGLISIGLQAFIGLGAYGLYVASDLVGLEPVVALPLVAVVVGGIALVSALFVFRLNGGYFAVGTWVVAEVVRLIVSNTSAVGAGSGVSIQSLAQFGPAGRISFTYWLAVVVGVGAVGLVAAVMRSPLGLALRATRDGEVAAAILGVDVFRTKLVVYVLAAAVSAAAGAVIYMSLLRIQPNAAFSVDWTARMIFVVMIGGLGSVEGPILGTVIYIAMHQWLGDFDTAYLILLGVIAIGFTIASPGGLWGLLTRLVPQLRRRHQNVDLSAAGPAHTEAIQ